MAVLPTPKSRKKKVAAEDAVVAEVKNAVRWKEKVIGASGSISGTASILGSWQICHNVCLGLIALLALIGITVTGMPLLFLTKIAVPMWSIALLLLLIMGSLYYAKRCFSRNLLFLNLGLIIAGIPFEVLVPFQYFFWTAGGAIAIAGLLLYFKERRERKCDHGK